MRVLVVEDERLLADSIAEGLSRQAMAVDVAYDGDAALERLAVNDYDVVVLDRDLPVVSGDEVCTTVVECGLGTVYRAISDLLLNDTPAPRNRWHVTVETILAGRATEPEVEARSKPASPEGV
jgi:response regulator RpfG family c-di-GMP phosphodiesterase